jgi:DNA damage-binding protein 1
MTLTTTKRLSLYDRSARQAEYLNDIFVDSSGILGVASCHAGKLKFFRFKDGCYDGDFDLSYVSSEPSAFFLTQFFSISELNILSLAFVSSADQNLQSLAILHQDHRERIQLLSRDINVADMELSSSPSTILPSTLVSTKSLLRAESIPFLVYVSSAPNDTHFSGGVLLFGGRKIIFYELASKESREKQRGKQRRTETRKKSTDVTEIQRAKQKELERESRKRKPRATVDWPWSEVTAFVCSSTITYYLCHANRCRRCQLVCSWHGSLPVLAW